MRAVEHLLRATARAEARHFWFRGFRRFVDAARSFGPSRPNRPAHPRLRLRNGRQPRVAWTDSAAPAGSTCLRSAPGSPARPAGPPIARATVTAAPFPERRVRPRHLVRRPLFARGAATSWLRPRELFRVLKPGGHAVINVAAMPMLTGDHSVLEPRTAPLHAVVAPAAARARRLHGRPPDIHQRDAVPSARDGARVSPVARPFDRGRGATGDRRAGGAPSTGP